MTREYIQATGFLLTTYSSDLTYIRDFHRYKNGEIPKADYLNKSTGTFKSFIDEFRVARNVDKTKTEHLLAMTVKWVDTAKRNSVDKFAEHLCKRGITHGKIMTSLASKLLFLNNPWEILPLDNFGKKTLGLKQNIYVEYVPLMEAFRKENKNEMKRSLESVDWHLTIIEKEFKNEISDIKIIRRNRFTDKLLWTLGRQK